MSLEHFDPTLRSNDLVQDLKWDPVLRKRFTVDEQDVLDDYLLRPEERHAIIERDFKSLYLLGLHPYLLGQLARLIYGNAEEAGSSLAATTLVAALTDPNPKRPGKSDSASDLAPPTYRPDGEDR